MANYIPEYHCALIKDGSVKSETKNVSSPGDVVAIMRAFWGNEIPDREHLVVLLVNSRHNVVGINTVSIGTLSASLAHPREVFKPAILASCAAVIVVHNHPSGDCEPSAEDKETTKRLVKAGELLGIPLFDHVIVSGDGHYSFREHGMI